MTIKDENIIFQYNIFLQIVFVYQMYHLHLTGPLSSFDILNVLTRFCLKFYNRYLCEKFRKNEIFSENLNGTKLSMLVKKSDLS